MTSVFAVVRVLCQRGLRGGFGMEFRCASSSRICCWLEVLDLPQKYGLSPSGRSCV